MVPSAAGEKIDEHGKPQQAVNNGRNGGEIIDIDLNKLRGTVFRRDFLQINRRQDPPAGS